MYTLLKQEGRAKRARLETVHGTIETPVFMNVGTVAAIKGAVSTTAVVDTAPLIAATVPTFINTGVSMVP